MNNHQMPLYSLSAYYSFFMLHLNLISLEVTKSGNVNIVLNVVLLGGGGMTGEDCVFDCR